MKCCSSGLRINFGKSFQLLICVFSAGSSFTITSGLSPLTTSSNIYVKPGAEIKVYHLVRPEVPAGGGSGVGGQETAARAVPEVFLTRLLATKGESGELV